jgi:alanine-alpha-ketoisovalerate/valine-pyruvate aminotransferase
MPKSPQRLLTTPRRQYVIRPEDAIELRALYEELPYAAMRAAEALRTDGTTLLRGDDLLPFLRAENAVTEIIQRINEILEPELMIHAPRP